jgi:uncharacterized protein (DUF736 family)
MYTIGTFTKKDAGYQGTINTLGLNTKAIFVPLQKTNEKAPDYRILTDKGVEFGAAWRKTAKESGNPYLQVTLDSFTLPAPIYARLVEDEDKRQVLIWSRN